MNSLKELLERHDDMCRSLPAVIGTICFEYHSESWNIETIEIG